MTTQPFSPDDYLGPYAEEATDEQKTALTRAAEMIAARYPDIDDPSEQAMRGAAQIILGDNTLDGLSREYARARQAEREAMARLVGAIIAASEDMTEVAIQQATGINRMTVRKALGK